MAIYILSNNKEIDGVSGLRAYCKAHNIAVSSKDNSTVLLQKCNSYISAKKNSKKLLSYHTTKELSRTPINLESSELSCYKLKLNGVDTDINDTELNRSALESIATLLQTKFPIAWDTVKYALYLSNPSLSIILDTGIAREWELVGDEYQLRKQIIRGQKQILEAGKLVGNYQEGGFIPYNIKQVINVGLDGTWLKPDTKLVENNYCSKHLYYWQIQELYTSQPKDYSLKIYVDGLEVFTYDAKTPPKQQKQRKEQFNRTLTGRKTQFKPQSTAINSFWNDALYSGVFNNPLASPTNNFPTQLRFTYTNKEVYIDRYATGGEFITWFRLGKVQILQDVSHKWYPIDGNTEYQQFLKTLNQGGIFPNNVSWKTANSLPFNYQSVEYDETNNILYGVTDVVKYPIATYSIDTYREIPTINIAYLQRPSCLDDTLAGVYIRLAEDWLRQESRAVAKQNKLDSKTEFNNTELKKVQKKVAFIAKCLDRLYVLGENDLQYYAKHLYTVLGNQWNAAKIANKLENVYSEIRTFPIYQDGTNLLVDQKLISSKALYHEHITPIVESILQTNLVIRK